MQVKVGDIVGLLDFDCEEVITHIGIVECIDPEEIGDPNEVLVVWNDGDESNHSIQCLEIICK